MLAKKVLATVVLTFIIAVISFFLYLMLQEALPFANDGQKITGTVVDIAFEKKKENPVIEYYTLAGTKYTYYHKDGTLFKDYNIGDSVEVIYLPNDPEKCQLAGFSPLWFFIFFLGLFNLLLIVTLYVVLTTKSENAEDTPGWYKYFFAVIWGLWFWAGGYLIYLDNQHFISNAEEATGTVISEKHKICTRDKKKGDKERYECYAYNIHFLTKESKRATYESGFGSRRRGIGDRVKLLYNKRNPANVRLDTPFLRKGILEWIFMGIGGVAFLGGLTGLLYRRK